MRITKQIATDVAKQLTAEKQLEITTLENKQKEYVTELYLTWLPKGVFECFNKSRSFFRTTSYVYVSGHGLNHSQFQLSKELPQGAISERPMSEQQAKDLIDYDNKISDLKKALNELKKSIEIALFNLRTYGNVQKEFPEAFKLLPNSPVLTGLMVNIKDIRCKLDKANC